MPALITQDLARDPLDPPGHLGRGPPGERHQQDAARVGAIDDQMRDPMGEGVGLAGPGAGDDQQRASRRAHAPAQAVLDGPPLLGIELFEVGHRHLEARAWWTGHHISAFPVLFATQLGRLTDPRRAEPQLALLPV